MIAVYLSALARSESEQMMTQTVFASLDRFSKGGIELISGSKKEYAFSNLFEVAAGSKPYERVAVAKNLDYVQEVIRAHGTSPWFACAHDEFAICMDGAVSIEYLKLDQPRLLVAEDKSGAVLAGAHPQGRAMGSIKLGRGHQALLNKDCAYRFVAAATAVLLVQTMRGDLTVERWAQICLS
jgi:hypothetical protein